ncbi:ABC transporter ATP-binding protein [Hydrogenophaga sp.]|jgi:nitrate/nitrite transport system ATP-binding protein|uniref:ABC transporter ATP-binding protein n=1 Tax=Hydrogenophaga sp. TaxID=1904254 RepID=UPI003F6E65C7
MMTHPTSSPLQPLLRIEGIAKAYDARQPVFDNLWFDVFPGEFICLIGHSGCGKTTILNILAGLDQPTSGDVLLDGKQLDGPHLDRAVVFQSHALLPWMTVLENIVFAVQSRWPQWPQEQTLAHARRYLELVHLTSAERKRPAELSGGMRQRVGIARALSIEPKILLLDEPFSALDALTRGKLQDELVSICRERRQTTFMITHDIDEAILLADRIVLMTSGPGARICEIVENTLPVIRARSDVHRHAHYTPMRNHLLEFLVNRSEQAAEPQPLHQDLRRPPVVRPQLNSLPSSV